MNNNKKTIYSTNKPLQLKCFKSKFKEFLQYLNYFNVIILCSLLLGNLLKYYNILNNVTAKPLCVTIKLVK